MWGLCITLWTAAPEDVAPSIAADPEATEPARPFEDLPTGPDPTGLDDDGASPFEALAGQGTTLAPAPTIAAPFGFHEVPRPDPLDPKRTTIARLDFMVGPLWRTRPLDLFTMTSVEIGGMHGFSGTFHDALLRDPVGVATEVLAWLGAGDPERAAAVVRAPVVPATAMPAPVVPAPQAISDAELGEGIAAEHLAVFDAPYGAIDRETPMDAALVERLNRTHDALRPIVLERQAGVDAETIADLAAFTRRSAPEARREASIAVMPGARPLDPAAPLLLFFQPPSFGILAPSVEPVPLDLASWCFRPTAFGYLASVSRPTATKRARAVWVMAACLPLVLAPEATVANAAPSVQRPSTVSGPPVLPDAPPDSAADATVVEDPTGAQEPATADDYTAAQGEPADPQASPERLVEPAPVATSAIVDAAWEGVDGFDVELELKGGKKMRGRVGAVQRDTFTLIQAETGAVLVMPKSGVASLRVRVPPTLPSKSGTGALVSGGILTGVATPIFISGIVFVAVCPSCTYIHLPLLLIGGGMLGAGIPLIVRGVKRREKYRAILRERSLGPVVSRVPGGWSGGVRFRF